jgi:xanthine dehydrogenase accessory factor
VTPEILAGLLDARAAGRAVVLATRLPDGLQYVLPDQAAPAALQLAASDALGRDSDRAVEIGSERWFLAVHAPAYRLMIVGAVHIAQALAPLAAAVGLAVTVVDPRRGFATAERFPDSVLNAGWPDEAVESLSPDARTAVVALSHDPKLDDPGLDRALRSSAFYIGALGSRKSHAARLERLAALGHAPEVLARIHGPVGLPIGAVTAPEIAVSILADIIATRRGGPRR